MIGPQNVNTYNLVYSHLAERKMSTREGNVVFLEDVIDKAVILAEKAISEKNPDLENKRSCRGNWCWINNLW